MLTFDPTETIAGYFAAVDSLRADATHAARDALADAIRKTELHEDTRHEVAVAVERAVAIHISKIFHDVDPVHGLLGHLVQEMLDLVDWHHIAAPIADKVVQGALEREQMNEALDRPAP